MAKEALKNFEGWCSVNNAPMHFSVTYTEREDGSWERRDNRDCPYRGLFNPQGCKDKSKCELLTSVKSVITAKELGGKPVEEYHLFDRLAAQEKNKKQLNT